MEFLKSTLQKTPPSTLQISLSTTRLFEILFLLIAVNREWDAVFVGVPPKYGLTFSKLHTHTFSCSVVAKSLVFKHRTSSRNVMKWYVTTECVTVVSKVAPNVPTTQLNKQFSNLILELQI